MFADEDFHFIPGGAVSDEELSNRHDLSVESDNEVAREAAVTRSWLGRTTNVTIVDRDTVLDLPIRTRRTRDGRVVVEELSKPEVERLVASRSFSPDVLIVPSENTPPAVAEYLSSVLTPEPAVPPAFVPAQTEADRYLEKLAERQEQWDRTDQYFADKREKEQESNDALAAALMDSVGAVDTNPSKYTPKYFSFTRTFTEPVGDPVEYDATMYTTYRGGFDKASAACDLNRSIALKVFLHALRNKEVSATGKAFLTETLLRHVLGVQRFSKAVRKRLRRMVFNHANDTNRVPMTKRIIWGAKMNRPQHRARYLDSTVDNLLKVLLFFLEAELASPHDQLYVSFRQIDAGAGVNNSYRLVSVLTGSGYIRKVEQGVPGVGSEMANGYIVDWRGVAAMVYAIFTGASQMKKQGQWISNVNKGGTSAAEDRWLAVKEPVEKRHRLYSSLTKRFRFKRLPERKGPDGPEVTEDMLDPDWVAGSFELPDDL